MTRPVRAEGDRILLGDDEIAVAASDEVATILALALDKIANGTSWPIATETRVKGFFR